MSGQHFDAGRDALDFIDVLTRLDDPQTIITSLRDKLASFGFHAFLITGLPETGDRIAPMAGSNSMSGRTTPMTTRSRHIARPRRTLSSGTRSIARRSPARASRRSCGAPATSR
jgi:hypothetical protein